MAEEEDDAQLRAALALSLVDNQAPTTTEERNAPDPQPTTSTSTSTTNSTPQSTANINDSAMASLLMLGLSEQDSRQALMATNNDLIGATAWHFNNVDAQSKLNGMTPQAGLAQLATLFARPNRVKMVLVVRTDLKMGVGKIAAQCGHAAVGLYQNLAYSKRPRKRELLKQWEDNASPKIALKVTNYEEMMKLETKATSMSLPTHVVLDAGRTQVAPGSATVLAIIGPTEEVDQVTGGLKLL